MPGGIEPTAITHKYICWTTTCSKRGEQEREMDPGEYFWLYGTPIKCESCGNELDYVKKPEPEKDDENVTID